MVWHGRAGDLIDHPVVTLDTAEAFAQVKDVVVDGLTSRVVGFTLKGRGFFSSPNKGVVPVTRVAAIGHDAIMIASADVVSESDEEMEEAARQPHKVIGIEVMSDRGKRLGRIESLILEVDGNRASVIGYEIKTPDRGTALLPLPEAFGVSSDTAVVPAAVEDYVSSDLRGFGETVARFRGRERNEPSGPAVMPPPREKAAP